MHTPIIYLTHYENRALWLLSQEKNYYAIERECNLKPGTRSFFLNSLRQKTGIRDTRNAEEVQSYLTRCTQAAESGGPSAQQLEVMRRTLGVDYPAHTIIAAANRMGIPADEAQRLYDDGLRAAGIFSNDPRTQRLHARMFLATRMQPGKQALGKIHERVLSLLAQGWTKGGICNELDMPMDILKDVIGEIAQRLGVVCRGRGAQDKLILFAAAWVKGQKENATKPVEIAPEYDLDSY